MSRQTVRAQTRTSANSRVVSPIDRYAQRNWGGAAAGFGAFALIVGLAGCPAERGNDKKPVAQMVDGGRMGEGAQAIVKPPEKKEEQDLSKLRPRKTDDGMGGNGLRRSGPEKHSERLQIH